MHNIPLSREERYCEGFGNPVLHGDGGYLVGFVLGTGTSPLHEVQVNGGYNLEAIDAFDRAEAMPDAPYIGQINMITVSSFCGPRGLLWGYDVVPSTRLRQHPLEVICPVPVYGMESLIDASKALFGTVDKRRFPFMPGSHVPCACKSMTRVGPGYVYAGLGVAIPKDRSQAACLLMEDVGWVLKPSVAARQALLQRLADSILRIGNNQRVEYMEMFCGIRYIKIREQEIGCALAAAPYFSLAQGAVPGGHLACFDALSLEAWQEQLV